LWAVAGHSYAKYIVRHTFLCFARYLALPHNPHNVQGSQTGSRSRRWGRRGVGAETVGCKGRIMRAGRDATTC
jgi:hypothetical protein